MGETTVFTYFSVMTVFCPALSVTVNLKSEFVVSVTSAQTMASMSIRPPIWKYTCCWLSSCAGVGKPNPAKAAAMSLLAGLVSSIEGASFAASSKFCSLPSIGVVSADEVISTCIDLMPPGALTRILALLPLSSSSVGVVRSSWPIHLTVGAAALVNDAVRSTV